MAESTKQSAELLRKLAEQRVQPSVRTAELTADEVSRLVNELEIHQEELEIQNEELRRTHLELIASRDRYLDLYDFAPVGYLTLNTQGEIAEANLTACELLGSERSRLFGTPLALFCDLNSRTELRARLDEVIATGNRQSTELRLAAEGSLVVQLEMCRSTGSNGDDQHCRIVLSDITARKQAEKTALEKDRHLRALADALPVLISYVDLQLRFQFSNRAHRDWFGLNPEQLIGETIHEALREYFEEGFFDVFQDAVEGRQVTFECALTDHAGELRQIQMMLVPDFSVGGNVQGLHTLCHDITEHKIVDEQNARRRSLAVKLDRLTGDERNVYWLLIQGEANKVIAEELDIGIRTVERRRQSILKKLEVASMAELLHALADIQGVATFVAPNASDSVRDTE